MNKFFYSIHNLEKKWLEREISEDECPISVLEGFLAIH